MNTAIIKNNIVENILSIDDNVSKSYKEYLTSLGYLCIDSNVAKIGDTWNGSGFISPSNPEIKKELPKLITKLAFRNRFTSEEKVNFELASLDNPNDTLENRKKSAMLRVYLKDLDSATYIDLNREDLKASVQLLETNGFLASGRANEILTATIQPIEIYKA